MDVKIYLKMSRSYISQFLINSTERMLAFSIKTPATVDATKENRVLTLKNQKEIYWIFTLLGIDYYF